jgi:hypothetical protein
MEIRALNLLLTEADANALVARHLPADTPVREVRVRLTPEGFRVSGIYPTSLLAVRFDTLWELSVRDGRLAAYLADLNVVGLPARLLRGTLMSALGEAAAKEDALRVEGETVLLDPERLLAKNGLSAKTNLTAVRCGEGSLVLECAAPPV